MSCTCESRNRRIGQMTSWYREQQSRLLGHWGVWDRGDLYKTDQLHMNWRKTNAPGGRFSSVAWEGLNWIGQGGGEYSQAERKQM